MGSKSRRPSQGFSRRFKAACAAEIARMEKHLDRVDRAIERAPSGPEKDALSAERERIEAFERLLRDCLDR